MCKIHHLAVIYLCNYFVYFQEMFWHVKSFVLTLFY